MLKEQKQKKQKRTNNSGHANATEVFPTHVDLLVKERIVTKSTEQPPKVINLLQVARSL